MSPTITFCVTKKQKYALNNIWLNFRNFLFKAYTSFIFWNQKGKKKSNWNEIIFGEAGFSICEYLPFYFLIKIQYVSTFQTYELLKENWNTYKKTYRLLFFLSSSKLKDFCNHFFRNLNKKVRLTFRFCFAIGTRVQLDTLCSKYCIIGGQGRWGHCYWSWKIYEIRLKYY